MAITNLNYLHDYSSNDKEFVIEMVELFLSSTPDFLDEMKTAFQNEDFASLGKIAHKMKPSMTFMGVENGKELTVELEKHAVIGSDIQIIESKMNELIQLCEKAFEELQESLKELKS